MSERGAALVFDVGGTHLRCGLFAADGGGLVRQARRPAPSAHALPRADPETLVRALESELTDLGREVADGVRVAGVGVAFPGPVDADGRVLSAPPLWGTRVDRPVPLAERLRERWGGTEVLVVNDVTAAGLRYAPERGLACVVNVGSGIGNKVFHDGRVLTGPRGVGGELGHWVVDPRPDAPRCDCGGRGHLGALSSGRAGAEHVRRLSRDHPAEFARSPLERAPAEALNSTLVAAVANGDPFAGRVLEALVTPLGRGLASLQLGVGIEDFVILGGFARALGEPYLEALRHACAEAGWTPLEAWRSMLRPGAEDDDSGLIGLGRRLTRP